MRVLHMDTPPRVDTLDWQLLDVEGHARMHVPGRLIFETEVRCVYVDTLTYIPLHLVVLGHWTTLELSAYYDMANTYNVYTIIVEL